MRQNLDDIQKNPVKRGYVDQPDLGGIPVPELMPGRKARSRWWGSGEANVKQELHALGSQAGAWEPAKLEFFSTC